MGTARDLTITAWAREAGDLPFTVAVAGLKLTGWWPDSPPPIRALEDLRTIWPQEVAIKLEPDILEDPMVASIRYADMCGFIGILNTGSISSAIL